MSYKNITLTLQDSVGIVKINRPDALNALNTPTLDELIEVQKELSSDTVIKVVIITGAGKKAFVSGGDIREMLELDSITV
jgi:enoyl-CoA hydratase